MAAPPASSGEWRGECRASSSIQEGFPQKRSFLREDLALRSRLSKLILTEKQNDAGTVRFRHFFMYDTEQCASLFQYRSHFCGNGICTCGACDSRAEPSSHLRAKSRRKRRLRSEIRLRA